jgi:class 3 adenylate cyclase
MGRVFSRTFEWRFDLPPSAMWPALADTARFNEAAGLPRHAIEEEVQADGSVRYFARARKGPFDLAWEEIPVEWVEGQWFRHERIFSAGPLRSLCATVRLESDGAGSVCRYVLDAAPANLVGTLLLSTGFFGAVEKSFGRLARSARDWAAGERETPFPVAVPVPDDDTVRRIDAMVGRLERTPYGHGLGRRIAGWLLEGAETDLAQIRPLALARRWNVPEREAVEAFLQGVREGLLQLRWDLLCPRCRGAKVSAPSLDRLPSGAHCDACNISYDRNFARNVEVTFQPAPAIRAVGDGEYCLFSPMTTPHIRLQVSVDPGSERTVAARFAPGSYRARTLEIGGEVDIEHGGGPFPSVIAGVPDADAAGAVRVDPADPAPDGGVHLVNRGSARRTFVVESRDWVRDALIAERVTAMQAFRDLFSHEVLRPGDEVAVSQAILMFTDLLESTAFYDRVGDAAAYHVVREHFAFLADICRRHQGAVVKTIGDAVLGVFTDPVEAVRAALDIHAELPAFNARSGAEPIVIRVGLHGGPCIAVTLNDRLDYFGSNVNLAARLQGLSRGDDIVLSADLAGDPAVAAELASFHLIEETGGVRGFRDPVRYVRIEAAVPGGSGQTSS